MKSQKDLDLHFMGEALKEARLASKAGDWPVGCVIVIDNKVVSRGRNKVYSKNNKLKHAELVAMEQIAELLSHSGRSATVYLTYEPCPMCVGAFLLNHVKRVVCGPDLDQSGGLKLLTNLPDHFLKPKYEFEITQQVLDEECKAVFLNGKPSKKLLAKIVK